MADLIPQLTAGIKVTVRFEWRWDFGAVNGGYWLHTDGAVVFVSDEFLVIATKPGDPKSPFAVIPWSAVKGSRPSVDLPA